ncbi:MAG: hypothetical protein ACR2O6_06265 [Ilumatobacteraceae bacterium]
MSTVRTRRRLVLTAVVAASVGLGAVSCGDDDASGEGSGDGGGEPAQAAPTDTGGVSGGDGQLSIATHCDPLGPLVTETLGGTADTAHNDFYVDRGEDRVLECSWVVPDREIDVGYNAAPSELMLDIADGDDLDAVDAPNTFGGFRLDVLAPNGWTVLVQDLGGGALQDPDEMARIANAAVDLAVGG